MFKYLSLLFISLLLCQSASALKSDTKKKVFIMSDFALLNYKTGIHTFTGHVLVDQGATHVSADKIQTISSKQHQIKQVTAYGLETLAHYWTIPKAGDSEIHARAKIIKFFPTSSNAILEKNAIVTQGNNSFRGDRILYDMHEETITVPASQHGKAVLIYDPNEKSTS